MRYTKLLFFVFCFVAHTAQVNGQELVRRGSLGFQPTLVDSSMLSDLQLTTPRGLLITGLTPNGSLQMAGAQAQDVLLSLNGEITNDIPALLNIRNTLRAGQKLHMSVWRNGREVTLKGKVQALPLETSEHADIIYDQFTHNGGTYRTIINKPPGDGPHPTIYFIPGYTCASVDNFHPIHPYGQLLDSLSALGYAIFRMEKPGIGDNENTGDCQQLGFHQELEAYFAGYEKLQQYNFIDQENVFVWGHSMGGVYAPQIARKFHPKGVVVYGIVHDTWTEYLLRMVRYQNPLLGSADYIQTDQDIRHLYALLYEHYHLGKSSKVLYKNPDYRLILERDFQFDGENQILFRHENFWRELYSYNLSEAWAETPSFVLSMNGEADLEVINEHSQKELVNVVNHYHPGRGTFQFIPRTDHSMIKVGTMAEGAVIRFQPRYRQLMVDSFNYDIVTHTHQFIQDKLDQSIAENNIQYIEDWANDVDRSLLKARSDYYDIVWNGEKAGSMHYHLRVDGDQLLIQDTSQMEGVVWETLDIGLDLQTLHTSFGEITMKSKQSELDGRVEWAGNTIKGQYQLQQNEVDRQIPIDISNPGPALGRGAIFALIPAFNLSPNSIYPLELYAFSQADIWQVELQVKGITNIDWHGDSREVWQLELRKGAVENIIYLANDGSGDLLQIDVVGQNMSIILRE